MRGALIGPSSSRCVLRIIPAYAGSTCSSHSSCSWLRDHPRVCGEHPPFSILSKIKRGSSPRMRGARKAATYALGPHGIIPAYAGSTLSVLTTNTVRCRIIPAYAGSTSRTAPVPARRRDHPRVCGEHISLVSREHRVEGSSPRMRGARHDRLALNDSLGIIPAYAGSTCLCCTRRSRNRGSSPRMRGALDTILQVLNTSRIIPAYAGSTPVELLLWYVCGDHPRVCGEHDVIYNLAHILGGIIPAYAGSTVTPTMENL